MPIRKKTVSKKATKKVSRKSKSSNGKAKLFATGNDKSVNVNITSADNGFVLRKTVSTNDSFKESTLIAKDRRELDNLIRKVF